MDGNIICPERTISPEVDAKNTKFDEIYKLFLGFISNDYRLKKMFEEDEGIATDMLKTWLLKAVAYFCDCTQDLEHGIDTENDVFTLQLSLKEKIILSDFMILVWIEWNINNITQMNLSLQDSDFKRHAESQNLTAKVEYANRWREQVYHDVSEYLNQSLPIEQWATGALR